MVKAGQIVRPGPLPQTQFDPMPFASDRYNYRRVSSNSVLARCGARKIQLPAQPVLRFEQGDIVAQPGGLGCCGHACGATADDGHFFG